MTRQLAILQASNMRFIDLSSDGGCSQKASLSELTALLSGVAEATNLHEIQGMPGNLPDVGLFDNDGIQTVASVDVIYPMVDDPRLFGKIAVNHALNDLYAALSQPLFSLCILGVPRGMAANDSVIVEMLSSAAISMRENAVSIIGGQTLAHQDNLFLGFAVVGRPLSDESGPDSTPAVGDSIIITKRLGTSIASLRWKLGEASIHEHKDVLEGMLLSNRPAAILANAHQVKYCTDVSGFGFVNNLLALTLRAAVEVHIEVEKLPVYASAQPFLTEEMLCTRQMLHNLEYSADAGIAREMLPRLGDAAWYDAQTAGGLLMICPKRSESNLLRELRRNGIEASKIGIVSQIEAKGLIFI